MYYTHESLWLELFVTFSVEDGGQEEYRQVNLEGFFLLGVRSIIENLTKSFLSLDLFKFMPFILTSPFHLLQFKVFSIMINNTSQFLSNNYTA